MAIQREREAAEAAELARLEAQCTAEKARRAVKQAQYNYEQQMRTLRAAQAEAGRSRERVERESRYKCAICGTEGVRRPTECPLQPYHYIMDIEKKKGRLDPKMPK